jgi:hypothetical protein
MVKQHNIIQTKGVAGLNIKAIILWLSVTGIVPGNFLIFLLLEIIYVGRLARINGSVSSFKKTRGKKYATYCREEKKSLIKQDTKKN